MATLLELNIRQRHPCLVYHSACGTGEIKDDRFIDESIHLTGFPHVIGTLWGVADEICVYMSRIAYEEILRSGMSNESVCFRLHLASRELRHRWLSQPVSIRGTGLSRRDAHHRRLHSRTRAKEKLRSTRGKRSRGKGSRDVILLDSHRSGLFSERWVL